MRVPAYELPPPGPGRYVTNWVGLIWEFLACEKLAQVNVGVNCVRAALEGHRRAGTAAHGAGAVYAGVFSTPQTEAGTRWIPLSDTALTLFTNRGRRAGNRSASRKGWCALHDFSLILRACSSGAILLLTRVREQIVH